MQFSRVRSGPVSYAAEWVLVWVEQEEVSETDVFGKSPCRKRFLTPFPIRMEQLQPWTNVQAKGFAGHSEWSSF